SLSEKEVRILTYSDQKWQLGRDRDYVFDHLPANLAQPLYYFLSAKLDQRFVAELATPIARSLWQIPVKLRHGLGGSEGILTAGENTLVYESKTARESRTWRLSDIDTISTTSPLDFSITTRERSDWRHAAPRDFVFDLKAPLSQYRYDDLWRRIEAVKN